MTYLNVTVEDCILHKKLNKDSYKFTQKFTRKPGLPMLLLITI